MMKITKDEIQYPRDNVTLYPAIIILLYIVLCEIFNTSTLCQPNITFIGPLAFITVRCDLGIPLE